MNNYNKYYLNKIKNKDKSRDKKNGNKSNYNNKNQTIKELI